MSTLTRTRDAVEASRPETFAVAAGSGPHSASAHDTSFVADTWNVMVRELKPMFREPASVLFAMVQPLVFLALFAPLLPDVGDGSTLQWFVPGIVAMTALMGGSFTGANLTQEIITGSHERLLVSPQFFDPDVLARLEAALRPGFVFIDIGANVGAYSLFVGQRTRPPARILAVEPHPEAQRRLSCNLALNGLGWVETVPVALSDAAGTIELMVNERNIGSSSMCAE